MDTKGRVTIVQKSVIHPKRRNPANREGPRLSRLDNGVPFRTGKNDSDSHKGFQMERTGGIGQRLRTIFRQMSTQ